MSASARVVSCRGTGERITAGKAAVWLPDELFPFGLNANAIAEYLQRQQDNAITERPNEVYSRCPAKLDSGLHRAQVKSLEKHGW